MSGGMAYLTLIKRVFHTCIIVIIKSYNKAVHLSLSLTVCIYKKIISLHIRSSRNHFYTNKKIT